MSNFQIPKQLELEPDTFSAINAAERALSKWTMAANAGSGLQPGFKDFLSAQEWIASADLAGIRFAREGTRGIVSAADVNSEEMTAWLSLHNLSHFRSFINAVTPPAGSLGAASQRGFLGEQLPKTLNEFAVPSIAGVDSIIDEKQRAKLEALFTPEVWDKYMNLTPLVAVGMRYAAVNAVAPYGAYTGPVLRATVTRDFSEAGLLNGDACRLGLSRAFLESGDYNKALEATKSGQFNGWLKSFARSTEKSAQNALQMLGEVRTAKAGLMQELPGQRRAEVVADYLSSVPHLNLMDMSEDLKIAYNTCATHVRNFERKGAVEAIKKTDRGQWYVSKPAVAALNSPNRLQAAEERRHASLGRIQNDAPLPEPRKAEGKRAVKVR